jgi:hypothetical protein
MKSWKARLLVVLTMLAMLLAVSVPAMADHLDRRFDPRFDPRLVDDRDDNVVVDEFSLGDLDCVVLGKADVDDLGRTFLKPKRLICVDPEGKVAVNQRV